MAGERLFVVLVGGGGGLTGSTRGRGPGLIQSVVNQPGIAIPGHPYIISTLAHDTLDTVVPAIHMLGM